MSRMSKAGGSNQMMVMVGNNSSKMVHRLATSHPGKIGWLMGPSGWHKPQAHIPYALDNDAYTCFTKGIPWDYCSWIKMLGKAKVSGIAPLWALVPDVVGNRQSTLDSWEKHASTVKEFGWLTAFAVQDGMSPADVPSDADVVFVGGTTRWKWRNLPVWFKHFPRVHVGRVRQRMLLRCEQLGAESCDGTGWFRESMNGRPARFLEAYIDGSMGRNLELPLVYADE